MKNYMNYTGIIHKFVNLIHNGISHTIIISKNIHRLMTLVTDTQANAICFHTQGTITANTICTRFASHFRNKKISSRII